MKRSKEQKEEFSMILDLGKEDIKSLTIKEQAMIVGGDVPIVVISNTQVMDCWYTKSFCQQPAQQ